MFYINAVLFVSSIFCIPSIQLTVCSLQAVGTASGTDFARWNTTHSQHLFLNTARKHDVPTSRALDADVEGTNLETTAAVTDLAGVGTSKPQGELFTSDVLGTPGVPYSTSTHRIATGLLPRVDEFQRACMSEGWMFVGLQEAELPTSRTPHYGGFIPLGRLMRLCKASCLTVGTCTHWEAVEPTTVCKLYTVRDASAIGHVKQKGHSIGSKECALRSLTISSNLVTSGLTVAGSPMSVTQSFSAEECDLKASASTPQAMAFNFCPFASSCSLFSSDEGTSLRLGDGKSILGLTSRRLTLASVANSFRELPDFITPGECMQVCAATPPCEAWSWDMHARTCSLSGSPTLESSSDSVGDVIERHLRSKACLRTGFIRNAEKHTLGDPLPNVGTPTDCRRKCVRNIDCYSAVFERGNKTCELFGKGSLENIDRLDKDGDEDDDDDKKGDVSHWSGTAEVVTLCGVEDEEVLECYEVGVENRGLISHEDLSTTRGCEVLCRDSGSLCSAWTFDYGTSKCSLFRKVMKQVMSARHVSGRPACKSKGSLKRREYLDD